jgi:hypothetical protein
MKKLLILLMITFIKCQYFAPPAKAEVIEIDDSNYEKKIKSIRVYFMTLCEAKHHKCKKVLQTIKEELLETIDTSKIEIKILFIDTQNCKKYKKHFQLEGLVTQYFVNKHENQKELYIGERTSDYIIKYIKEKLLFETEEVYSENELIKLMKEKDNIETTILFAGNLQFAPYNLHFVNRAAKLSGIRKIFFSSAFDIMEKNKLELNDWDLIIYRHRNSTNTTTSEALKIYKKPTSLIDTVDKLKTFFLIKLRRQLKEADIEDLEIAINRGVRSLFFIYESLDQYKEYHNLVNELADKFKDESILMRLPYIYNNMESENKPLQEVLIKYFKLQKDDLPALIQLAPYQYPLEILQNDMHYYQFNPDDVQKYICRRVNNDKLKLIIESGNLLSANNSLFDQIIFSESLQQPHVSGEIKKYNPSLLKEFFKNNMNGSAKEILVLLIATKEMREKYLRIVTRFKRLVEKFKYHQINFGELDPFYNELQYFSYKSLPAVLILWNNGNTEEYTGKFQTYPLTQFIQNNLPDPARLNIDNEKDYPYKQEKNYDITIESKLRVEGRFINQILKGNSNSKQMFGLKRMWKWYKMVNNIVIEKFEDFNKYSETDDEVDQFEYNVDEGTLIKPKNEL